MHFVEQILKNTLTITAFVLSMMLLIEYINVRTKGALSNTLSKKKRTQVFIAAIFGIIPGCLGTYTVVSMYTHNIASIGALVTVMIATMGDEAFYIFSMSPKYGFIITILLFVIAVAVGFLVDFIFKRRKSLARPSGQFVIHGEEEQYGCTLDFTRIKKQLRNISFHRAILIAGILLFIGFIVFGGTGHSHDFVMQPQLQEITDAEHPVNHESEHHEMHAHNEHEAHEIDWISLTFIFVSFFTLFVTGTVSDHFLEDHLWKHILKKHFLKVLLWTLLALLVIEAVNQFIDFKELMKSHKYVIMLIALLVGLIPESGPHMFFVSMFVSGNLPISILIANSIVQDGHGALPLFAESKASFILVKIINFVIGALVGYGALLLGF